MRHAEAADRRPRFQKNPFQLGVASGDPTADGVVLWTRLAPEPVNGGGMPPEDVRVAWQVSEDEAMTKVVRKGTAVASQDWAHSVHVEVRGLKPDRVYWYQFKAGDVVSPKGRTRTAPAADVELNRLRFAFASCQHFEHGYYIAYRQMVKQDLHAIVHLGDYIYEGGTSTGNPRRHDGGETVTLEQYRNRHALYKTDPDLQAAHAAFPWLVTWDDHEFDNNYAAEISEQPNVMAQEFLKRRADAYQAYYEHMPLRRSQLPQGPAMQLYRGVSYGRLAKFHVLDTRQYRTDQPCGDRNKPPCQGVYDPHATLLGKQQEQWLCDALKQSPAKWNILAQQVMMARVDRDYTDGQIFMMDQWGAYDVARTRLLKFMRDHNVSNPVVLTGDIHNNYVNNLKVDFDKPEQATVATEFVGSSLTSGGNGPIKMPYTDELLRENPFVEFHNGERAYVQCELTPKEYRADYHVMPNVTKQDGKVLTRASFVVEHGQAGAKKA